MIWRNRTFWVVTIIFVLLVSGVAIWIVPRVVGRYRATSKTSAELDQRIEDETQFLLAVDSLSKDPATLNNLYEKASTALPTGPKPEILSLQIEGLIKRLNLNETTFTLPYNSGKSDTSATTTTTDRTKVPDAAEQKLTVTIGGAFGFSQTRQLLNELKVFSRWNRVKQFSLQVDTATSATNLDFDVYWSEAPNIAKFTTSGSKDLIENAKKTFDPLGSYATLPDISSEGQFGRNDPFAAP